MVALRLLPQLCYTCLHLALHYIWVQGSCCWVQGLRLVLIEVRAHTLKGIMCVHLALHDI